MSFDVVVADPPWQTKDKNANGERGASFKYPTMPLADICNMQLPPIADNAWLFLWRIACMPQEALDVVAAWGFKPKTEIVWQKLTKNGKHVFALGHYTRGSHETCLIATRGSVKPASKSIRSTFSAKIPIEATGLFTKRGNARFKASHSGKPDEFFDIVEKLTGPGLSRVELFSRRNRPDWTCLGNEAGKRGTAGRAA